jgi:hypothetical protein
MQMGERSQGARPAASALAVLWLLSCPACSDEGSVSTVDPTGDAIAGETIDAERDTLPTEPLPPPVAKDASPDSSDARADAGDATVFCEPRTTYPYGCDRLTQTGCRPGENCVYYTEAAPIQPCDVRLPGTMCWPAGTGKQGEPCSISAPCAVGLECLSRLSSNSICRQICDPVRGPKCPAGLSCDLFEPSYTAWECR